MLIYFLYFSASIKNKILKEGGKTMFGRIKITSPDGEKVYSGFVRVPKKGSHTYKIEQIKNNWLEVGFDDLERFTPKVYVEKKERATTSLSPGKIMKSLFFLPELPLCKSREVNGKDFYTGAFNKWRCSFTRLS